MTIAVKPMIKPCPCCGHKAHLVTVYPGGRHKVACIVCTVSTDELLDKALVIADWNRREQPIEMCSHGIDDGEYCEPCNLEYKRAANDSENQVVE